MNPFKCYRRSLIIKNHTKCKHIIAGDYSYYSGYYHGHGFDDCVMYLDEADNQRDKGELDQLIIGKFCSIATGAKFMMGGTQGHNYNWIASYPLDEFDDDYDGYVNVPPKGYKSKGNTIIGNDVWIGAESMIMPGIKIADGAVIAARSHVTKNIGPYEIWGGNPAKLIKKRFSDSEIEKLLEIKWWDWNIDTIKDHLSFLRSSDVNGLWERFKENKL